MKNLALTLMLFGFIIQSHAQFTWSEDIAEIVYDNCTACHRDGGIGPFSLMSYESASTYASSIDDVILTDYMPPWSPDPEYQTYAHQRVLTTDEKIALIEWVNTGAQEGDISNAPPPPVYPSDGYIVQTPDVEVQIPEYTSQATVNSDDYVCFSLPLELTESKKLRGFEVVPGNPDIVHHCLLYIDEEGTYESDLSGICVGPTDGLIGGYTPGAIPTVFPSDGDDFNLGVTIPAGSNLVLAMHFPEGSFGETDDTKVRLFFYDDAVQIREIQTEPIIQNWSFFLPEEQITEVDASFNLIPADVSLLSVFPHMHLLGKYIKSYGVTTGGDTLQIIDIPHWDFEWQQFYAFENLLTVPAWTTIHAEGAFDNTSNNPHNPNTPPLDVYPGLNTADEMFLVYFQFLPYETGDELIDLEDLITLPTSITEVNYAPNLNITAYPNPVDDVATFKFQLEQASIVSLYIFDRQGRVIDKVLERQSVASGSSTWNWRPNPTLAAGMYSYSARVNGKVSFGNLILR